MRVTAEGLRAARTREGQHVANIVLDLAFLVASERTAPEVRVNVHVVGLDSLQILQEGGISDRDLTTAFEGPGQNFQPAVSTKFAKHRDEILVVHEPALFAGQFRVGAWCGIFEHHPQITYEGNVDGPDHLEEVPKLGVSYLRPIGRPQ